MSDMLEMIDDDEDKGKTYICVSACAVCICQNHALLPIILSSRIAYEGGTRKFPDNFFTIEAICPVPNDRLDLIIILFEHSR